LSRQPQAGLQQSQYLDSQPFWPPLLIGGGCTLPPLPPDPLLPPDPFDPLLPPDPPLDQPLPPAPPLHRPHEAAHAPFIQACPHQPYSTAWAQVSPFGGGVSLQVWLPPDPPLPLLPPVLVDPPLLVDPPALLSPPLPVDPPVVPLEPPEPTWPLPPLPVGGPPPLSTVPPVDIPEPEKPPAPKEPPAPEEPPARVPPLARSPCVDSELHEKTHRLTPIATKPKMADPKPRRAGMTNHVTSAVHGSPV